MRQQACLESPDTCLCAQNESNMLEQHVVNVRTHIHAMTEDPSNKERLYVTNEDIVKLASIGRDTVFAVTAPQGTSLIVPDPDKTAPGQPPQYRHAPPLPLAGAFACNRRRVQCCGLMSALSSLGECLCFLR